MQPFCALSQLIFKIKYILLAIFIQEHRIKTSQSLTIDITTKINSQNKPDSHY